MRKAPGIVFALVLVLAVCLMFIRLLSVVLPQEENEIDTSAGMSYLAGTEQTEITESLISEMTTSVSEQTTETETVQETSEETTPETTQYYEIKDGNFRAAYDDIIIAGDSLVKAIAEYGILDDDQVIAEIGAHTRHLSSVTDQIVYSNPKYLVLHYGENELDEEANAPYFISRYKECIIRLQEELPDTEIFVGSISPFRRKHTAVNRILLIFLTIMNCLRRCRRNWVSTSLITIRGGRHSIRIIMNRTASIR